jgi:integrase/recombinase XerD
MNTTFEDQVSGYIKLRRGLGCRIEVQGKILLDFGRFLDRLGHVGPITAELALQWAVAPVSKDPDRTAQRLGTIRGFLRHRAGFEPATAVPPTHLLGSGIRRKPPHIYSGAEIDALMRACRGLRPRGGLRPHTYETMFSLLLSTGLRISEALHLQVSDVDVETGVLKVRDGKFGKSRLVPLHSSARRPLSRYVSHRDRATPPSTFFFRTEHHGALPYSAVRTAFDTLRRRLEWTCAGRSRRPRIQDMRHTFAVGCLLRWYRQGIHPDRKIGHLATYLGHTEVRDTYWYLSAVPELSALAAERFERFASPDMPEVS